MATMDEWYICLFSVVSGALTAAQREALAKLEFSWVVLNPNRLGRAYIEGVGRKRVLLAIEQALIEAGRDPRRIAIFEYAKDAEGVESMVLMPGTADKAEYLAVAPDVVTYTYDVLGNVLSAVASRPTQFIDLHQFAGWPHKTIP